MTRIFHFVYFVYLVTTYTTTNHNEHTFETRIFLIYNAYEPSPRCGWTPSSPQEDPTQLRLDPPIRPARPEFTSECGWLPVGGRMGWRPWLYDTAPRPFDAPSYRRRRHAYRGSIPPVCPGPRQKNESRGINLPKSTNLGQFLAADINTKLLSLVNKFRVH